MTTIQQVAERAGVSPATVSRVLSGASRVTPAHQERVIQAVAELGYRPNRLASNLRRRTTATLGVVVSDIENPHFTQMVRGVEDAAYRRGFRVLLCNTDETPEKQRAYLQVLADERVVGVILAPSDASGAEIRDLLDTGIPVVAFDREVNEPRADAVVVDNVDGVRRATEHLLQLGHEQIGFIGGPSAIQTGAERLLGYEQTMHERGLRPLAEDGEFRIDQAETATARLLDEHPNLTALIVANNLMTIGALHVLRERGVRVPEDIALVAIDDPFWAELVEPPLTSLAQPVRRMADSAVRLLYEQISGSRRHPKCIVFDFQLHVRRSCGAALLVSGDGHQSGVVS